MQKQYGIDVAEYQTTNEYSRQEYEAVTDFKHDMNSQTGCGQQRLEQPREGKREQDEEQSSRGIPTLGRSECRTHNERNYNNFNTYSLKEVNLKQNHISENKFDLFPESAASQSSQSQKQLAAAASSRFDLTTLLHSDFAAPQSLQRTNFMQEPSNHNKINQHHYLSQKPPLGNEEQQQQEHEFLPSSEEYYEEKVKLENLNESYFGKALFSHKQVGNATSFPASLKLKNQNMMMMMNLTNNNSNDINFIQCSSIHANENNESSRGERAGGNNNSQMMLLQGSAFHQKQRGKQNLYVNDDSCNHMVVGNQKINSNAYDLFSQDKTIKQMSNSNSFMRINNNCGGQQFNSQQSFYPNSSHFFRSELFSSHIKQEVEQCPFNKLQQEIASQAYPLQTVPYSEEQPRYVNAAQFKRMMIMRIKRAARDLKVKKNKGGGVDNSVDLTIDSTAKEQNKKYKYESRHKHATNRVRDSKGRFIPKEKLAEYYEQLERDKREKEINYDIESSTQKTDYFLKSTTAGQGGLSPNQSDFDRVLLSKREMIPSSE